MKTFNVYKNPDQAVEAVKIGFSWPAFCFGVIWKLVKKLWVFAGGWLALYLALSLAEKITDNLNDEGLQGVIYLLLAAAYIALWLIPGFKGNKWREIILLSRGYVYKDTLNGNNSDAAIALWHKEKNQFSQ